jgi:hypothetical protein
MITDEYIKIKVSKRNINHFSKYYNDLSLRDVIKAKPSELQPNSNKKVNVKCDICNDESIIKYQAYNKNINSSDEHPIYTCVKCSHIKLKSTNLKKYGVEYYSKTEEYTSKFKSTMKERYNVEYSTQSKEIYDKIKKTTLNNHGVDNIFKDNNYIKKKFKEKYGVEHPSNVESIYNRIKESNLKSTGYESPLSSPKNKRKDHQN